jgi:hypothetical protein
MLISYIYMYIVHGSWMNYLVIFGSWDRHIPGRSRQMRRRYDCPQGGMGSTKKKPVTL